MQGYRLSALAALLLTSACAIPTQITPRPPEGYEAIRFRETVRFTGAVGNTWEFTAGTVLVADRKRDDGAALYCGPMVIRDLAVETRQMCVMRRGGELLINADHLREGFVRTPPPGSLEMVRLP